MHATILDHAQYHLHDVSSRVQNWGSILYSTIPHYTTIDDTRKPHRGDRGGWERRRSAARSLGPCLYVPRVFPWAKVLSSFDSGGVCCMAPVLYMVYSRYMY